MSVDTSLKKRGALVRSRNVLKRHERIQKLMENERFDAAKGPLGLPKVRVFRVIAKKTKKKEEKAEAAAGATPAAAPAATDKKAEAKK